MNLLNESPLLVAPVFGALPNGEGFAVIVKGTFAIVDDGVAALAPKRARAPFSGEKPFEPASPEHARYATDFAPWKPRADVLMMGTHPPDPRPGGQRSEVTLTVGTLRKTLALAPSDAPHTLLGFAPIAEASPSRRASLGTFDEAWLKTRWPYFPEDFDWSAHNAAPADQRVDGYLRGDELVRIDGLRPDTPRLETRLPGVRPRAFVRKNGAPASGAEELPLFLDTLWIDADAGQLVLVWRGALATSKPRGAEVDALLLVEEAVDAERAPLATYLDETRWQQPSRPSKRASRTAPKPTPAEGLATAPPAPAGEPRAAALGDEEEPEPTEAEELAALRTSFEEAGAEPSLLALFDGVESFDALQAKVAAMVPPNQELPDVEKTAADANAQLRAAMAELNLDLGPLDELERAADADAAAEDEAERAAEQNAAASEPAVASLDREAVRAKVARGENLAGADLQGLDLSNLELSRAKLSKANLAGANLTGTQLVDADLSGANVSRARANGANFDGALAEGALFDAASFDRASLRKANLAGARAREASFVGARFDGADCHGVDFAGVNLEGAFLERTDFGGAKLDGARLLAVTAVSAIFRKASLIDVDAKGADLSSANVTGATLHRASFEGATLASTSFDAARGDDVRFDGASARKLRAGNGATFVRARFQGIDAERAVFSGANLDGADFSNARLVSAAFREASLGGATFHLAKLEASDFTRAVLTGARLTKVNLFQARLPEANLSGADCRMSNFFGAEFFRATVTGALFEGSNIGRTKLEGGLVR